MEEAYQCLHAWGFQAKTILTWTKGRIEKDRLVPHMGVGDWLRGQTEHCLMAVRGEPLVKLTNETTALIAPAREHSRKPNEFYDMVRMLCPGRRMDKFAREEHDGFIAVGAEVGKFAESV